MSEPRRDPAAPTPTGPGAPHRGESLSIQEVGLRDGLQGERTAVPTATKLALFDALRRAGLRRFELSSFVSPRAVPQMADAAEIVAAAAQHPEVHGCALVVNERGYERARAAGARGIAIVCVISEELSQRNSRMSARESLATTAALLERAGRDRLHRRAYLAPAWACPYAGPVAEAQVLHHAEALAAAGLDELALADTIGAAHPAQVGALCRALLPRLGQQRLAVHLHDTQGLGLANAWAAISEGVRLLDASVGGLGGCPFAPGAAGNLATEDLVLLADKLGLHTGVALAPLWEAVAVAERAVDRRLGGRSAAFWRSQQTR